MRLRGKSNISGSEAHYTNNELFSNKHISRAKSRRSTSSAPGKRSIWEALSRREFFACAGAGICGTLIAGLSPTAQFLNRLGSLVGTEIAYATTEYPEDGYYTIRPLGYPGYALTVNFSNSNILTLMRYTGASHQEFRIERTTVNTTSTNLYTIEPTRGWENCIAVGMTAQSFDSGTTLTGQTRENHAIYQRFYLGPKKSTSGDAGYIIVPEGNPGFALTWDKATSGVVPYVKVRDDANGSGTFTNNQLWEINLVYSLAYSVPETSWKNAAQLPFLGAEYAACKLTENGGVNTQKSNYSYSTYTDYKDGNKTKYGYFFRERNVYLTTGDIGYDLDGSPMCVKITMLAMKGWNGDGFETDPNGSCFPTVAFLRDNFLTRWETADGSNSYLGFQLETWCAEARIKMEWLKSDTGKAANCKIAGTFADVDIARNNSNAPKWSGCEGVSIPLQKSTFYRWSDCVLEFDSSCGGVHIPTGTNSEYDTSGYDKKTMVHFITEEPYLIIEYSGQGCGTRFDFYYPNIVPDNPQKQAVITSIS